MATTVNPEIFKTYDIRGIYPKDINEQSMELIIKAIYTFLLRDLKKDRLIMALGRDMRISSPSLFRVAKKTLMDLGAQVIDIGLVSTPTFYYACLHYGYDGGIQISASHNPKDYNGIKYVKRVGTKIVKIAQNTGMKDVQKIAISKQFAPHLEGGKFSTNYEVLKNELDEVGQLFSFKTIKPFKVVADPGNAMGAQYLDKLYTRIKGNLVKMNFKLDGTFPAHQPDPLQPKNLLDLQARVIQEKADLGIAPDGDGERVFFVDEKGRVIPSTLITSLISRELLKRHPGEKILIDIRYLRNAQRICKNFGGKPIISPVGHSLITEQLNKENAIFAGESSGHFFFRETGGAESALRTIMYVLKTMSVLQKPISQIVEELRSTFESGEYNYSLPKTVNVDALLNKVLNRYEHAKISHLDGISASYSDWRFNIRTSNTEPLLRLNVEGNDRQVVGNKLLELQTAIKAMGGVARE